MTKRTIKEKNQNVKKNPKRIKKKTNKNIKSKIQSKQDNTDAKSKEEVKQPVIGVVTIDIYEGLKKENKDKFLTCVERDYVLFCEGSGARVIPI